MVGVTTMNCLCQGDGVLGHDQGTERGPVREGGPAMRLRC
jgi:hypothetical protein